MEIRGDGMNPLRKRSTDAGLYYPRRRATIAVGICAPEKLLGTLTVSYSGRYVTLESHDVMGRSRIESSALSWVQSAFHRELWIMLDTGEKLILGHLARIEGILHSTLVAKRG